MQTQRSSGSLRSPGPRRFILGYHVTTITMFFGLFNLVLKLMFFMIRKYDLLQSVKSGNKLYFSIDNDYFVVLSMLSCWDFLYIIPGNPTGHLKIPVFLLLCTSLITLAMYCGVLYKNQRMLLPLICSQLIEILLDLVSYWKLQHHLPYINFEIYQFICPVLWKGYFVIVIWKCYNYLMFMERDSGVPIRPPVESDDLLYSQPQDALDSLRCIISLDADYDDDDDDDDDDNDDNDYDDDDDDNDDNDDDYNDEDVISPP